MNCNDHPLPFFPDQYNEDWFFFSRRVAARDIVHVGEATQAAYDPFENPGRARQEEFGDLLAEGLFAKFANQSPEMAYRERLASADVGYWEQFIAARRDSMTLTGMELAIAVEEARGETETVAAAIVSLDTAADQLSLLSPRLCVDYLDAWADDLVDWERATERLGGVGSVAEALNFLGLQQWRDIGGRAMSTGAAWT